MHTIHRQTHTLTTTITTNNSILLPKKSAQIKSKWSMLNNSGATKMLKKPFCSDALTRRYYTSHYISLEHTIYFYELVYYGTVSINYVLYYSIHSINMCCWISAVRCLKSYALCLIIIIHINGRVHVYM